ncbi:MAG: tyrosine-type recombinase/integrase [Huintestinicola sp.]
MEIILKDEMEFGDWLGYWYETYAKRTVKQSTAVSYDGYINGHINPTIGKYKLSELNTDLLQRFYNLQSDCGNLKGGGLSPKTLKNMNNMMHKSLDKAVELDLLKKNYTNYVELPKNEEHEMRVLTNEEQSKLMNELEHSRERLYFGVFLSITLGLRLGECLGLRWEDIDFRQKVIHIRRTVNRLKVIDKNSNKKTELVVGTPKSRKSVRDIPITEEYCVKLLSYEAQRSRIERKFPKGSDYLLQSTLQGPAEPKTLQECFKRILKSAEIEDANFHALRHTFATRAIEKGVDVKTLSVILGHADVNITLNRYAHVLDEQKRKTMNTLLSGIIDI